MIICSRCKTENEDGANFCTECESDLTVKAEAPTSEGLEGCTESSDGQEVGVEEQQTADSKKPCGRIKNSVFFRKKKNTIITLSAVILVALLVVGVLNSGYIAFATAYNMEKYEAAKNIQGWSFNSDTVKANIEKFMIDEMEYYYQEFREEKISYEEVGQKLEIANDFYSNEEAKSKVDRLQNSRDAFDKATGYEESGKLYNATVEYLKVIAEDQNYATAQEAIEKNKPAIKQEALLQMEAYAAADDYNTGLQVVSNMEKIFPNDADIIKYKEGFEERKEAHRIQGLKEAQIVKVVKAYAYNETPYIVIRKGTVVVKNYSDQVMKEFILGVLMFDNSGYPVDVEYFYQGDDNCQLCSAPSANVQPGDTYGSRRFWYLPDNATKIKACVKSAEFYDGSTWENPYYEYWLEKEKDRY